MINFFSLLFVLHIKRCFVSFTLIIYIHLYVSTFSSFVIFFQRFLFDLSVPAGRFGSPFGARGTHLGVTRPAGGDGGRERRKVARGRGSARATRRQPRRSAGGRQAGRVAQCRSLPRRTVPPGPPSPRRYSGPASPRPAPDRTCTLRPHLTAPARAGLTCGSHVALHRQYPLPAPPRERWHPPRPFIHATHLMSLRTPSPPCPRRHPHHINPTTH